MGWKKIVSCQRSSACWTRQVAPQSVMSPHLMMPILFTVFCEDQWQPAGPRVLVLFTVLLFCTIYHKTKFYWSDARSIGIIS